MSRSKINELLTRGMRVEDLREALACLDDDAIVVVQVDYGDYHHTQQALPVEDAVPGADVGTLTLEPGYSRSGLGICEDEYEDEYEDEGDEDEYPGFVVLKVITCRE